MIRKNRKFKKSHLEIRQLPLNSTYMKTTIQGLGDIRNNSDFEIFNDLFFLN